MGSKQLYVLTAAKVSIRTVTKRPSVFYITPNYKQKIIVKFITTLRPEKFKGSILVLARRSRPTNKDSFWNELGQRSMH